MSERNPVSCTALATARIWQPLVCLSLLAGIGLSVLTLDAAIHNEALGIWLDRKFAEVNGTANFYRRQYVDNEDRALLEELETLDVSRGGVYFFGGSNMMWATCVPDLPSPQRHLVHNFGVGGESSARYVRQYVEFLVNHKNLLQAGADKSLIVFGTCFLNIKPPSDQAGNVFTNMWRRRGLYRYDLEAGIQPVPLSNCVREYVVRKGRYASLVHGCLERFERWMVPKSLRRRKTPQNAELYATDYRQRLGTHWQEDLAAHRRDLQQFADYVKREKMNFVVVLLPLASWHKPLPYPAKYRAMIEEFCTTNGMPLIDYTNLLADDDFVDHIHVNPQGLPKIDSALMDIARKFLREKGVWPGK